MKPFLKNTAVCNLLLISIFSLFSTIAFAQTAPTYTFTVTKTDDPDPFTCDTCSAMIGTLRWAITEANEAGTNGVVNFNIPGGGLQTIKLNSTLPNIGSIIVDASTQPGYQYGNPAIIIDANSLQYGFFMEIQFYGTIKGFYIKNFQQYGILVYSGYYHSIIDNVINSLSDLTYKTSSSDIVMEGAYYSTIKGNFLGTDVNGTNYKNKNAAFGIASDGLISTIIGDTTSAGKNIIAYHDSAGVRVDSISYNDIISGNEIYNNTKAIVLENGGNNSKPAPTINTITDLSHVTGKSAPGDTIELFGSTGPQNANQYLTTVIAGADSTWSASINPAVFDTCYSYISATATNKNKNTSELTTSNQFCNSCTQQLSFNVPSFPTSPVTFINTSTGYSNSTVYIWNFGNGQALDTVVGKTPNPIANYSSNSNYTITLSTPASGACPAKSVSKKIAVFSCPNTPVQNTFVVTKITDPDPFTCGDSMLTCDSTRGSLRWAINMANAAGGFNKIVFNIPGASPHVIKLNNDLFFYNGIIDGSSQPDYQCGNPSVVIDGHDSVPVAFILGGNSIIKGLYIKNFLSNAIVCGEPGGASSCNSLLDNVINNLGNDTLFGFIPPSDISLLEVFATIKGNTLGTDINCTTLSKNSDNGIYVTEYSSNIIIGDTSDVGKNIIAYHKSAGIFVEKDNDTSEIIFNGASGIKISGNTIFSNGGKAIDLKSTTDTSNNAPTINNITSLGNVIGTANPGNIIELFGSTGTQTANQYLTTVVADASGRWSANLSAFNYCIISATATDTRNNTSELTVSNQFCSNLSQPSCGRSPCNSTSPTPPPPPSIACTNCIGSFAPEPGKYLVSAWVKEENAPPNKLTYTYPKIFIQFPTSPGSTSYSSPPLGPFTGQGIIIDGWQRIEAEFVVPTTALYINLQLISDSANCYFDDIRIFPFDGSMKSYVYDPVNLRLVAELDERNYATLYEYDEEGKLIRVKKETENGVMTIKENRNSSFKQ